MSLKYVIIDAADVADVDFSQVFETSAATLRWNIDPAGTQTFVKYEGAKPRFLYGMTTYTHSEILAILSTSAWSTPRFPPDED